MFRIFKLATPVVALAFMMALVTRVQAADEKKTTGAVSGTVTDKDGKPVADVSVKLFSATAAKQHKPKQEADEPSTDKPAGDKPAAPKGDKPKPVADATTDKDGKFTMSDVPVGSYVLRVNVKGQGHATQKVEVQAGETADVTLKLGEVNGKPK
jgi:protocatechuate 3,4-dioxygenase beta subunit